MTDHKATYPVEVEYLDGTKETIDFPRISSGAFFDAFTNPTVMDAVKTGTDASMMILIKTLVNNIAPGLLDTITIASGMALLTEVANKEAGNLSLGEAPKAAKPDKKAAGRSKTPKS